MDIVSVLIAAASLVVCSGCLLVAWLQYRRMPKPPKPNHQPSVVAFTVAQMQEPPSLPGYDRKRRNVGFNRRVG